MIWRYAYICSKVRGMKSRLLSQKDFEDMLASNSLEGVYKSLEETPYKEHISTFMPKGFTSIEFEKALSGHFIRICDQIMQSLPEKPRRVIAELLKRFETENLKALLRAKIKQLNVEEVMKLMIPIGNLVDSYKEIFEKSENVEETVNLLASTEYGPSLKNGFEDYKKTGALLPLDVSLDKYAFRNIWNAVSDLHGIDKEVAQEIIGTEVDLLNVKSILRCKSLGFNETMIKSCLIPIFHKLNEKNIGNSIKMKDIKGSIKALIIKPYEKMFLTSLEKYNEASSIFLLELILDKFLIELNRSIPVKYPSPFHIGTILSFLNLKWAEIKNLRAIVRGIETKTPIEKVKSTLFLV